VSEPRPPAGTELAAEVRRAMESLAAPAPAGRGSTSDLSVDEALLLHSVGWEAVELVSGVSVTSVPWGTWSWGQGEIAAASAAHATATSAASARMAEECAAAGGHGVVGVRVQVEVSPAHVGVALVGTAVRPVHGPRRPAGAPFLSDLSGRDFCLLHGAGWRPTGLAFGASFVYAPRRTARAALGQAGQNVELANFTQAFYQARELAMERMQRAALALGAQGVVAVVMRQGPMAFATHAVGFTAWGTAVRVGPEGQRHLEPAVVVSLDDSRLAFEARSLRAQRPGG
jgi:uncharacterized protein YbjQ (UPF0145 family)